MNLAMNATTANMQQLIDEFQVRGFVVLNNTLSSEQVSTLNRAVDSYLERFPFTSSEWAKSGSSSYQAGDVLPRTSDFDLAIESPITLSFGRAFLGEAITFEHLSIVIRSPEPNPTEPKGWHRDNTRDYDRRKEIGAISVIYYLSVANCYFARQFLAFGFPARMPRCAISSSFSSMSSLFLPDSWVRAASVLWSPSPFFLGNNS